MGMSVEVRGRGNKRTYRRHSLDFKARVVEACLEPGASVGGIALAHQLNANLVRRWVKEQREGAAREISGGQSQTGVELRRESRATRLIPVALVSEATPVATPIEVEIRQSGRVVQVRWPVASADSCAKWLRELLG